MTILFIGCFRDARAAANDDRMHQTIIFLHGMGRTRASMMILAKRFKNAGYETINFPYGQKDASVDEISDALADFIEKNVRTQKYHLIGHSLGNVIIRNALRKSIRPGLGRIVMLAPPNRAAQLAKLLKENRLYHWLMGDSGQKLAEENFYRTLPVPSVEFGIIAGDKGQRLTFDEPNDGIIDVEGTKLVGMKAFVIVHHTHTFLMNAEDTFGLCKQFLESGNFDKQDIEGARPNQTLRPMRAEGKGT